MNVPNIPSVAEMPAAHLAGLQLPGGWRVDQLASRLDGATGGVFSICYEVSNGAGQRAFLKALNFHAAVQGAAPFADQLHAFTAAYVFERDLLAACMGMRRVVRLLAHGEVDVPGGGSFARVPYLILEMADGDIRRFQAVSEQFDCAWALRTMKHVLEGLEQLHAASVAHQDLKPSNVLTSDSGRDMKLGDLGCADRLGMEGPRSSEPVPGAWSYAPPEQLYGEFGRSWEERRAGDMYLAGSLGTQLFLGHSMSALLQSFLPEALRPLVWRGFFRDVLPYLREAHVNVITELRIDFERRAKDERMAREYAHAIREMTDPDPALRGHSRERASISSSYGVRRYVSLMNRLSAMADLKQRGVGNFGRAG